MNKIFFKIGLGVLALASVVWPSRGAVPGGMKTLHGHVPAAVARSTDTGRVSSTNTIHLAIGLPLRNQDQFNALLQGVSDPSSPNYRHYLSPEEFTAQFGPSEDDAQAVMDFAKANGLTVKRVHSNRMLIEVDGNASDVEHAFNVTLHTYHSDVEKRDFYAPDKEPTVAASLPVLDVQGLNSYVQPRPRLRVVPGKIRGTKLGSGPFGTYFGNDFRSAYVPGTALNGTGQKVALFEYDGYLTSDILAYEQQAGFTPVTLTNILLQGFSGTPTFGAQDEVTLDIDMAIDMAPSLGEVLVYEGNFGVAYLPNLVLNRIATDNSARQVSCSYGWQGGPSSTTDQIFQQMIIQGQSFFDASGDVDAFLPPGNAGSVDDPTLFNAPSDDPYITQVGATTLQTTGPGGAFQSESVWNYDQFGEDGVGSSGGISGFYPLPSWQQGVSTPNNQGSSSFRNLPDVAMPGDNIYIIVSGSGEVVAGTSCAAPLWAGYISLANQQAASEGLGSVGFINPAIYALAKTPAYTTYFHDVMTGSNAWSQSPNEFFAVQGYDLCTGWGSPNGTALINALATASNAPVVLGNISPIIPAPKQPWGNTLSLMDGGNPNGLWMLYYQDDKVNNLSGTNYNGWAVNLTTANPIGFAADNQVYVNTTINSTFYGNATNVVAVPGSAWHTTLAVTNYGPSLSSNAFLVDTLPISPGVTLVSSNSTIPGSSIAVVGPKLIWNIGNLITNTGGTLTLNFSANNPGIYTNLATVGALTSDPNPDDDTVLVIATVAFSTPPMLAAQMGANGANHMFKLSITNDPGATINVQQSTNLLNWVTIFTGVSPFTYTNLNTAGAPAAFYRAVTTP